MSSENLEVVYEGWLTKSPPAKRVLKAVSVKLKWRRRWFVLRHSGELPGQYFLAYYTDKSRRKMKGRIDLDQCEQVDAGLKFEDRKSKYHYMFDIKTPKRTYYLAAESEEDMNKWVDFVCHVCSLKPFTVDENADFECTSVNICRQFPPSTTEEHSSPDSPTSMSSSHYIPISECISGKPLLPIFPRPPLEESYDTPRPLRPPPRPSERSESPPPSPGSESVFTDDESVNSNSMNRPSVNWQTFPCLPQNSPDIPIAVNKKSTKKLLEAPPPRPPKPSHLIETPTKTLSESRSEALVNDETYDFPRQHQMTSPNEGYRRNCYTNAAPGHVSGNFFTYDFVEEDGKKIDGGKTPGLESPSSINSLSAIVNASSTSLDQNQTPPAVNRETKPKIGLPKKSAELSPLTPTTFPFNPQPLAPPIINRKHKPNINKDKLTKPLSISNSQSPIHRRHSASDDRLASDKVSSYQLNKISSNSQYRAEARRFNDIQYLDLEFEPCEKQYSPWDQIPKNKSKTCHRPKPKHDYSHIDQSNDPYKKIDIPKTIALHLTMKATEKQRMSGRHNEILEGAN